MSETWVINSDYSEKAFAAHVKQLRQKHGIVTYSKPTLGQGNSWPMKKTWRMWMGETADWMAENGATMPLVVKQDGTVWKSRPFGSQDAHELFIRTWLGIDEGGERYKTASGNKGDMLRLMDQHLAWAVEKGIQLTIPREGEYARLSCEVNGQ